MQNLKVYIHVAKMFTWEPILSEVLEDCRISGLRDAAEITLVSVGEPIGNYHKCRVVNTGKPLTEYEFPTLQLLYDETTEQDNVCYLHLKGASQPNSLSHREWRRELLEFTIIDWKARVLHLEQRWTSGARVRNGGAAWGAHHVPAYKHYSGNFWWARGGYIRKLPSPYDFWSKFPNNRYAAESWLGQLPIINELMS